MQMSTCSVVKIKGITGHGKNRVREHGDVWKVLRHTSPICNELFIESVKTGDRRWLTKDFEVINE
jgi:hypothetical protein